MPTKSKRSVSAPAAAAPLTAANKATNTPRAAFAQEFNPDYTHVLRDLKQIAIMAGSFLVILIALSFILR